MAVGTSIAVTTKEPVEAAEDTTLGPAVILASTLKFSRTERNKKKMMRRISESESYRHWTVKIMIASICQKLWCRSC